MSQVIHDLNQQFAIPRGDEQIADMARRRSIETEKIKVTLPLALQRQRLEVERLRTQHKLIEERLKRMTADRQFLTTKATTDGIVYYGKIFKGRTSDSTLVERIAPPSQRRPHQPGDYDGGPAATDCASARRFPRTNSPTYAPACKGRPQRLAFPTSICR